MITETVETQNALIMKLIEALDYEHDPMHGSLNFQWKHRQTGERHTHEWFNRFFIDLNACAEFEKTLGRNQKRYEVALVRECSGNDAMSMHGSWFSGCGNDIAKAMFATAEQRCSALVAMKESE